MSRPRPRASCLVPQVASAGRAQRREAYGWCIALGAVSIPPVKLHLFREPGVPGNYTKRGNRNCLVHPLRPRNSTCVPTCCLPLKRELLCECGAQWALRQQLRLRSAIGSNAIQAEPLLEGRAPNREEDLSQTTVPRCVVGGFALHAGIPRGRMCRGALGIPGIGAKLGWIRSEAGVGLEWGTGDKRGSNAEIIVK